MEEEKANADSKLGSLSKLANEVTSKHTKIFRTIS